MRRGDLSAVSDHTADNHPDFQRAHARIVTGPVAGHRPIDTGAICPDNRRRQPSNKLGTQTGGYQRERERRQAVSLERFGPTADKRPPAHAQRTWTGERVARRTEELSAERPLEG